MNHNILHDFWKWLWGCIQ